MAIGDEKFVSVTTFRKSGVPVATPTWIVALEDGKVGFWTSSASGKAKRLRNGSAVTLQPCSQRGRVVEGSAVVSGTAALVTSGKDFDDVQRLVRAKYGFMVMVSRFLNTLGHLGKKFPYGDVAVVVTPDSGG